jgi:hypothetical protein
MAARVNGLPRHARRMLGAHPVRLGMACRRVLRLVPRLGLWTVVVAVVGHANQRDVVVLVVVVLDGVVLVSLVLLGEDDVLDDELSEFALLEPLEGDVDAETLPEAFIDAVVDVSVDGVVVVVVLLAGAEVSVEVVVVAGDDATVVVEPGVALVPELL